MDVKHYIFTRWSVYDPRYFRGFKIVLDSAADELKQKLFDESRLAAKFEFFEKMTYPSVRNQTYNNYEWYIYTSTLLPQEYKDKLEKFQNSNITVVYVDGYSAINRHIDKTIYAKQNFISINLDDDDGIAPNFLEKLNGYVDQIGKVVTFSTGMNYTIKDGTIIIGRKYRFPNINVGIAAIGHDILKTGGHSTVHERYSVIIDETPDMWWCACSDFCDTKRAFKAT